MTFADEQKKMKAARFSVAAAIFLSVFKVSTGLMFHSLGMLSAGLDSMMDVLVSTINFLSMKQSVQPADKDHPYGHGKIENIASLLQGLFLGIMGLILIGEGVREVIFVHRVPDFDAGILVMICSSIISFWVGRRLARVGKETDSPLLQADSFHFAMDTYTNTGVVIALVLAQWQGKIIFDQIIGILIGLWVIYSAFRIFRSSTDVLMDKYIPEDIQKDINRIILSHSPEIIEYHKMRTRRSGSMKLIDLHLVTCKDLSLAEAHRITDHIEKEIQAAIKNSDVVIHMEPCLLKCPDTKEKCRFQHHPETR
ncbi:MAG: cation diffusion facilitator family transporter [bacterium]